MTQAVALAQQASTGVSQGLKNRIINGAMVIDQRNAGAATANTISGYTVDRWNVIQTTTGKLIAQQNAGSVTPPAGFTNYLGVTSQSAYSIGAGDFYAVLQSIEGYNVADLGWGTADAKTVTLSFWVRSSGLTYPATFGGALNNGGTRSYPFTYTISAANTWEQKSITIAGDTSGTWGKTTGHGVQVWLGLGVGSTYSGTAGAWVGANYLGATGATSVVGTNGATFYITGVQFEVGSTATSFDYRPYGTELALCQRYFQRTQYYATSGGYPVFTSNIGLSIGANNWFWDSVYFPITMRTAATVTTSDLSGNTGKISIWTSSGGATASNIDPYTLTSSRDGFSYSDYSNAKFGIAINGYIASAEL